MLEGSTPFANFAKSTCVKERNLLPSPFKTPVRDLCCISLIHNTIVSGTGQKIRKRHLLAEMGRLWNPLFIDRRGQQVLFSAGKVCSGRSMRQYAIFPAFSSAFFLAPGRVRAELSLSSFLTTREPNYYHFLSYSSSNSISFTPNHQLLLLQAWIPKRPQFRLTYFPLKHFPCPVPQRLT